MGYQVVDLEPGEFVFGRRKAALETGLTEREIRTSLARLKNLGNLTIKSTNKFSVIRIVNWETYQGNDPLSDHQHDQQATSKRPQTIRKEREEEKGEGKIPYHEIVSLYHEHLPSLPRIRKLTGKRKKQIKARWFESEKTQTLEWWREFFEYVSASPFLTGGNGKGWTADLEWLTQESNFIKTIEGKYHQ